MFRTTLLYSGNTQYVQNALDEVSNLKFYNKMRFNFYVSDNSILNIILWKYILKLYVLQMLGILSLPV